MRPPSGAQYRITSEEGAWGLQEVTVVEVGAGLRSYETAGAAVVDGYGEAERCSGGRGQLLIPWPNRLRDGRYRIGAEEQQLALTEPARHNAIHGLVRWSNWAPAAHEPDRVVMETVLYPQPGYPFILGLSVEYRLGDAGLAVATTATNLGDAPCPYGAGAHPFLTVGTDLIDAAVLRAPGSTRLETDERAIPVGAVPVGGTRYDFRAPRRLGDMVLDTAYTDMEGGEVVVSHPDGSRRVTLWMDGSHRWLMLFTGDTLGDRSRRGLAVEPMTCAPNAFVSGDGLRFLEPQESWTTTWGVRPG